MDAEFDDAEFRYEFNTDEGYREVQGQDMSTVGPGPGNQRMVFEGDASRGKKGDTTPEQVFTASALKYMETAYRNMESRQRHTIVDQCLMTEDYQNLFMKILVAAVYFRQLNPSLRSREDLTEAMMEEFAPVVLAPLYGDKDISAAWKKKITMEGYRVQLQGDLLRYLRYILPL